MSGNWPDDTVFTAVIDDGIAFAHEQLRIGDAQTRVEAFWNMNALFGPPTAQAPSLLGLPGEWSYTISPRRQT